MSLWTALEARAATGGRLAGPDGWKADGVSIDSRTVAPGDLFIALAGPSHDGHDYVQAAIESGAVAALVHRVPEGCDGLPLLLVDDTMAGLQALGIAARARSWARIVAVTGSVGKTGTKEMLAVALAPQGATHWSVGSFNNHWGVPLSLARMPADCRFAIFELGMNHPGEITPLVRMVRPHVAVVTTVEAVHMAHFASVEEIADAKAEIFAGIEPGGTAVLNRDNPHFRRLETAARAAGTERILTFGSHIDADARLLDCGVNPEDTCVFALFDEHPLAYRIGVSGAHWAMNSLAVVLAAGALGADATAAARALGGMNPPKGRGERHLLHLPGGTAEMIDESYNASPVSMKAAIATLAAVRPGKGARRIAVLGDMLELGEGAAALHAGLAEALEAWRIDLVCTAGPLMANLWDALPPETRGATAANSDALAPLVRTLVRPGDVVMVKGSAGSRMGRVVKALLEGN
ncbi:UDP-N-acetylmuramoylalanyl-D-glutamyl-2,6-diaminopimelate--D-alanyl-D-alanine ligase [Magnetospirillum sp. UT-4]|uniref:UDP-N-acetylmuramoylalanyl-D-glutamyl-2, 6-diaminopimelate--D-alanyl-D-alanine ligase n=1 Tax=Magnetospirillum sp. UT-4 TaxID=2681467 RepID=UPI00138023F1|nr:UDP-N-acetylmuramoylalanyl-D-glutamyl-2,6-diaminopimelate--D-alanyl-D-alanine ligase [Magnetospirillum sp. UT-4]CAA7618521.1 UDP-N-acetylmuramoyl-tripeptide--D-alanyl-D-alanine ligase [Magnetospirillum sp. UT-4]